MPVLIDSDHQRVIHHILATQKERIVPDTLAEELLGVFTGEKRGFVDEIHHILVEQHLISLASALHLAISHGSLQIENARWHTVVK